MVSRSVLVGVTASVAVIALIGAGGVSSSTVPGSSIPADSSLPTESSGPIGSTVPVDPRMAGEAAATALVVEGWAAWQTAMTTVDDPEAMRGLATWFDPGSDNAASQATELIAGSLEAVRVSPVRLREHPSITPSATVEAIAFPDPVSFDAADVTACVVSAFEEYSPPAEGSSVPVDSVPPSSERLVAARHVWQVRSTLDGALVSNIAVVAEWPGATTCPSLETTATSTAPVDPRIAEEAAIQQVAAEFLAARTSALIALGSPEAMAVLETYVVAGGPEWVSIEASVETLRRNGWLVRRNDSVPETVTIEHVEFGEAAASSANATACVVDTGVVYMPPSEGATVEVIVNDQVAAGRVIYEMQLIEGRWKIANVVGLEQWMGASECEPES